MQTAVQWLDRWFRDNPEATHEEGNKALEQANKMFEQQIKDAYYGYELYLDREFRFQQGGQAKILTFDQWYETYGSKGSDECYFEPTTNTSSATICKHCGREKFMHTELQQINQDNPVTRGSTALVPTSCQTEISDAGKDTADYIDRHIIESMKELAREGFKPQVSEISDEEIEKEAEKITNIGNRREYWKQGIKWYREQLKQKQ